MSGFFVTLLNSRNTFLTYPVYGNLLVLETSKDGRITNAVFQMADGGPVVVPEPQFEYPASWIEGVAPRTGAARERDAKSEFATLLYQTYVGLRTADHPAEEDYLQLYEDFVSRIPDVADRIYDEIQLLGHDGEIDLARNFIIALVHDALRSVRE